MSGAAPARSRPARAADALTATRAGLAAGIAFTVWTRHPAAGAALLGAAWVTDAADGRLARRSAGDTRLGSWDLGVDTLVGLGLLIGLSGAGYVPAPWLAAGGGFVFAWFAVSGNPALGMALQGIAYGGFLVTCHRQAPSAFWGLVGVIVVIASLEVRRLFGWVLPTFFGGVSDLVRRRSGV
jgi:phosphatidylglycerophosphate synthase